MANENEKLRKLRDQIDDIDNTIQDLLIKRTEVVEHVRVVKETEGAAIKIRPSREAEILYRLISRHHGSFPKRELARIWRELIVATLSSEGPFSMAVYERDNEPGFWDLARDQYGSFTPATRHTAARRVIEAVQTGKATIGVVPVPSHDDEENWWHHLVSDKKTTPRVIARLPFIGSGNARNTGLEALVICPIDHEETGRDRSYIAIESQDNIGFNVIEDALSQAGFSAAFHQLWHDPERPPEWTYLIEVFGYANPTGRQMIRLKEALQLQISRIIHLGGYAMPLSGTELAPSLPEALVDRS